jgi:glyoxylase-like metal-dependent hydrolase (beta-lactamase superfamily II)
MNIHAFFDRPTCTLTYLVWDADTLDAVVIDPVLDFDPVAVRVSSGSLEALAAFVRDRGLRVHWTLDTHVHADHLSGAQFIREHLGAKSAIGSRVTTVQQTFATMFNLPIATDGSQFDKLLDDEEVVAAGSLEIRTLHTPGHTPGCAVYKIQDALFTGDVMFMPDFGTGRCDFPGGSANALFDSVSGRLYQLPDETRVFVGHDYQPGGRELAYETTIGASKRSNKQLRADTPRDRFIQWRTERDATLKLPRLLFQSVQINANAGRLPEPATNGLRYLLLPINALPINETF